MVSQLVDNGDADFAHQRLRRAKGSLERPPKIVILSGRTIE
jgi:hypothetical protein